ncbi:M4 family metallopeptidase [Vulgatibacter incomptus]|nr:M4 family metallopeptidase [Vulgatibacter incomptus]
MLDSSSPVRLDSALTGEKGSWAESPFLDEKQKYVLARLEEQSAAPLIVEIDEEHRVVTSIGLRVPIQPKDPSSIDKSVFVFTQGISTLWRIDPGLISITPKPSPVKPDPPPGPKEPDCTIVNVGAHDASGRQVVGTGVSVRVQGGLVTSIVGNMWDPGARAIAPERISASEAVAILQELVGPDALGPGAENSAQEVVFDPRVFDDDGDPSQAWAFSSYAEDGPLDQYYVVDAKSRSVVVRASFISRPWSIEGCVIASGETPSGLPRVSLNPNTGTPALMSFRKMGGARTTGAKPIERAYDLMLQPGMIEAYGSKNPWRHLQNPDVYTDESGMSHVHFDEYYGGIPVAGAGLTVGIRPNGNAEYVAGTFVFDPQIEVKPKVSSDNAVQAATERFLKETCDTIEDANDRAACEKDLYIELLQNPPATRLVVFSTEVFHHTEESIARGPYLAWEVLFPDVKFFVDADEVKILYTESTSRAAWYQSTIRNVDSGNVYWKNDVPVYTDNQQDPLWLWLFAGEIEAAINLQTWKEHVNKEQLRLLGTQGPWGLEDPLPNPEQDPRSLEIHFGTYHWYGHVFPSFDYEAATTNGGNKTTIQLGRGMMCPDVFAHEYTHGFNYHSGLMNNYGYEAGAIDESIADFASQTWYPNDDGGWEFGRGCARIGDGGLRDLGNPGRAPYYMPEHTGAMDAKCTYFSLLGIPLIQDEDCAHFWAGVPNKAAVYMADGIPWRNQKPFGRSTTAGLLLATVKSRRLANATRFVDLKENVYQQCKEFVASRSDKYGKTWTQDDCTLVDVAYGDVGIESATFYGYYAQKNSALFGSKQDVKFREDDTLFRGCTLTNQTLVMETRRGGDKWSTWADGMEVSLANGEAGARVTYRASLTDLTKREVHVHRWSEWNHWNVVWVTEDFPPGFAREDCVAPDGFHLVVAYSTAKVNEWPAFFDGHSGNRRINWDVTLPAGCQRHLALGIHYHDTVPLGTLKTEGHKGHGYSVSSRDQEDKQSLGATLHWWHDGLSQIHARVAYRLFEQDGRSPSCLNELSAALQPYP